MPTLFFQLLSNPWLLFFSSYPIYNFITSTLKKIQTLLITSPANPWSKPPSTPSVCPLAPPSAYSQDSNQSYPVETDYITPMHTALHGISSHSRVRFPTKVYQALSDMVLSYLHNVIFYHPPYVSTTLTSLLFLKPQAHSCLMLYTCYFICPRHSSPQFLDDSLLHFQPHSTLSMPLPCFSFLHSPYYSWHTRCFTSIYFIVRHWSPYHYHYKLLKGKNVCFVPYGYSQQLKYCLNM